MAKYAEIIKVLDAVAVTTTSSVVNIEDAEKVMLVCNRANHDAGSSAFTAEVSVDGTNFVDYKKWISNANNTNEQDLTRVTTLTLGADTTDFLTMSPEDGFQVIRVTATETTDGTHSAWLYIQR